MLSLDINFYHYCYYFFAMEMNCFLTIRIINVKTSFVTWHKANNFFFFRNFSFNNIVELFFFASLN